jgi:hypothetical protein
MKIEVTRRPDYDAAMHRTPFVVTVDGEPAEFLDRSSRHVFAYRDIVLKVSKDSVDDQNITEYDTWQHLPDHVRPYFAECYSLHHQMVDKIACTILVQKRIDGFQTAYALGFDFFQIYVELENFDIRLYCDDVDTNRFNWGKDRNGNFFVVDYGVASSYASG